MTSAPRATPPVASNPSATRRAPAVIDIACSTFDFNRGGLSLFAGRRVPLLETSTRLADLELVAAVRYDADGNAACKGFLGGAHSAVSDGTDRPIQHDSVWRELPHGGVR